MLFKHKIKQIQLKWFCQYTVLTELEKKIANDMREIKLEEM